MTTNPSSPAPAAAPATPTARRSVAVLLAALLLAGCGRGGGGDDDGVASVSGDEAAAGDDEEAAEEELYDWVACMNDEGVEIPDPTRDADGNLVIEGDGFTLGGGEGGATVRVGGGEDGDDGDEPAISPDDMEAATEVCGMPPRLGPSDMSEEDVQARQEDALAFAECMREEGVEDFPDPDFSGEGPGGEPRRSDSGDGPSGPDDDGPRIALGPFGEIDMDDPTTAAAFEACQDIIGAPGGPRGPGGPGGGPAGEDADT
jgi:hypothetical protein